jgi:HSP20 family protein
MHRLIKLRIIRDYESLEERVRRWMDALFEFDVASPSFRPAADFYETPRGLVLRMEVGGLAKEELSLALAGQELVIRGRRRPPEGISRFLHLEIGFGTFERSFLLPVPIDPQGVEAHYQDGMLEVHLPRLSPKSRHIPVKDVSDLE